MKEDRRPVYALPKKAWQTGPMTAEQWDAWRATIPFTNEQIVGALRQAAAEIVANNPPSADGRPPYQARHYTFIADHIERTGKFKHRWFADALPYLIHHCAICGKKAWYRIGPEGRCRAHRTVSTPYVRTLQRRLEARDKAISEVEKDRAKDDLRRAWARRLKGGGSRKGKGLP